MELPFKDVPEGATIIGAFACIKALDDAGRMVWYHRYSDDIQTPEAMGQLEVMKARLLADILEEFEDDEA